MWYRCSTINWQFSIGLVSCHLQTHTTQPAPTRRSENALEKRIDELQNQKLVIKEKLSRCGRPLKTYDEMYRTSMRFLQEPHKIWACGRFEDKRAVLKLTFTDRQTYVRKQGYRTPDLSLPFRLLGDHSDQKMIMVPVPRIELGTF